MTSIPSNFDRVPTRLASQLTQQGINSANSQLLRAQVQLATSKRILRPSDDPIAATLINVLDQRLSASGQRGRNLQHASSVMGVLDQSLGNLNDAVLEAKEIALSQVGAGSDAATRQSQAVVVQSLIDSVFGTLNRDYVGMHLFGGERTGEAPIEQFYGGFRYRGTGEGLRTDLGDGINFPITIGADGAAGALSAEHAGTVDLNPQLTSATRISDLRGPGGGGNTKLDTLTITIDDGTPPAAAVDVDLTRASTIGDVMTALESAIRSADPAALTGAFPSAVSISGERIALSGVAAGCTVTFADGPAGRTATSLGLANFGFTNVATVNTDPASGLNPALTDRTTLGSLSPSAALTLGSIVFRNGGRVGTVTTNAAMTIGQLQEEVSRLNLGVRLEIDGSKNSINIMNEVSGFTMSVEDSGGGTAATTLGIRTMMLSTALSKFNHGKGVAIADGAVNPLTGLPDGPRNRDFRVTLTDGSTFDVDLRPADIATLSDLISRINAEAATAGFGAVFNAQLASSANSIQFSDSAGGAGQVRVTSLNGYAAEDLGLLDGKFGSGPPATLNSSDRNTVRVDSILSSFVELRDSLQTNNALGITFAGERLEAGSELAIRARSLVGARAGRIEDAQNRLEDTNLLDQSIKSDLQDLDYVEAASRFGLLQTQLQAGLQSAAAIRSLTLLNFLG